MDVDQEQEPFRALFSELKRVDEAEAPSFGETLQAATARRHSASSFTFGARLAAAVLLAACGIAVAVVVGHFHAGQFHDQARFAPQLPPVAPGQNPSVSPGQPLAMASDPSILTWQSPTAFLLDLSADQSPPPGATTEPAGGAIHESPDHRHL